MDVSTALAQSSAKACAALAIAIACGGSALAANDVVTLEVPGVPGDAAFAASLGLPADSIEIFGVSGGFTQVLNIGSQSGGAGAGKVTFNPIKLSKHFGASSPAILLALAQGTVYQGPVLINFYHVTRGGEPKKYFSIALSTVAIESDELSDSETRPLINDMETVSFDYGVIAITDLASGNASCWNRIKNNQC
jgi:type VI secretion system Hcp family effector